jgi:hypothetical protein
MVAAGFGMSRDGIEDDATSDTMEHTTRDSVRTGRGAEEYRVGPVR